MSTTPLPDGVVVFRRTGGAEAIDAIDEHSRRLVAALGELGVVARYEHRGVSALLAADERPAWILLQYNPFRYGRSGFAPGLVRDLRRLRARRGVPLIVMVHEAWIDMHSAQSRVIGLWQRMQLREILGMADAVMASTESLSRELGPTTVHVPVPTNVSPVDLTHGAARQRLGLDGQLVVTLFGRANPGRALDHAEAAVSALAEAHGPSALAVMNLGADAPPIAVPAGVRVDRPGPLPQVELSVRLRASDVVLLPFSDGLSTRRGTLMAAIAHGRAVIGLSGRDTDSVLTEGADSLVMTPVGDPAAYARAAVELAADQARRDAIGDAANQLYASHFAWPLAAGRVAGVLDKVRAKGRAVVFVAHEVGGMGGMERQSEELVRRLLETGRAVTVVARSCSLPKSKNLRFVRVPTPRRPFSLAYPAFFLMASVLVPHRDGALLHTTGAVILNRADASTVHYCHRAATANVTQSRASHPGRLYQINDLTSRTLSRAAERWCYRPGHSRLLCAVSDGVASELRHAFPAMANAVRTVPNGVDCRIFRPDPVARAETRGELGLGEGDLLALFVGGDWERKGLTYAVDALAGAPGWHLAVAGNGDPSQLVARARTAGVDRRLRLLGGVHDVRRLYAAADAFVLPTAYETFSLVTYEAAASGLPLLVTRVSGVEELLREGLNGWFIARDASDIARRLNRLNSDPGLAQEMGARARADASRYSWDSMATGYTSVYAELSGRAESC